MIDRLLKKLHNLSDRNKIVLQNVVAAFVIKGLALVVSLFTMPAYMRFFHNETALGLWFTVLSVLNWILNFDLGIGNGLRNHLARAVAEGNFEEAKRYVSSAYISIGAVCGIAAAVLMGLFQYVNWNTVFNISESIVSSGALLITVQIVFLGIIVQLFLKLISSVLYAIQKSSVNNFLTLCTSVLTIIAVSVVPSGTNDENMIRMAMIHAVVVALPLLVATIVIFGGEKLRATAPSVKAFSRRHAKDVLSLGGIFFFVQIVYMLIMNTNEYFITLFVGNEFVVEYQIYNRLFMLGSTVFALAMTPIWSLVTKAIAEKDFEWVKRLYGKLMRLALVGIIGEFSLIPFLQTVVNIWLQEEAIQINFAYAIAFAVFGGMMILNSVLSSIANGMGILKIQAVFFGIGAVVKIPLAYILVGMLESWVGVVVANIIALGMYCVVQPTYLKKYLQLERK